MEELQKDGNKKVRHVRNLALGEYPDKIVGGLLYDAPRLD